LTHEDATSPPDPRAIVRVFDELLWRLRREGFDISTAQAVDALRVARAVGIDRRADVRDGIAAVVVQHARDRVRYDATFEAFFAGDALPAHRTLWERLADRGFAEDELDVLRDFIQRLAAQGHSGASPLAVLLAGGAELDRLLAISGIARSIDAHSALQLGFQTHRVLGQLGAGRARQALAGLRSLLVDALGARGQALADALTAELDRADDDVRAHVRRVHECGSRSSNRSALLAARGRRRSRPSPTPRSRTSVRRSAASPNAYEGARESAPGTPAGAASTPTRRSAVPCAPAASPSTSRASGPGATVRSSCCFAT